MLVLFFCSIICETITIKDIVKLTSQEVNAKMSGVTTAEVILENVTYIYDYAFFQCDKLISIKISSSVNSIGIGSFYLCSNLENVSFEEKSNLIIIGECAFNECINLKSIKIPSSVNSIGLVAFESCLDLENISFEEESN